MHKKTKLLFLTASPRGVAKLSSDVEIRDVEAEITAALDRDKFEVASSWAVRTSDLTRELYRHRPSIVHFSGHGSGKEGIVLEGPNRRIAPVSGDALASLFECLRGTVEIVFLNACETRPTAEAIQQVVDYTIAMRRQISDAAAISFATGFYCGLGWGEPVPTAFKLGITRLKIDQLQEEIDIPELFARAAGEPPAAQPTKPTKPKGRVRSLVHLVNSTTGDIVVVDGDSNFVTGS
jgi:CHAT domain